MGGQRVVSFSPALTQMAVDLGVSGRVVGVGAYDPAAPPGAAVMGHLYRIDYEKLLRAEPTDVLMQITAQETPGRLQKLAERHGWELHRYRIDTAEDALRALYDGEGLGKPRRDGSGPPRTQVRPERQKNRKSKIENRKSPHESVGEALHRPERARELAERVRGQLAGLERLTQGMERPRVLMLVGRNPATAVGPDTFLHEMLAAAGGRNVLEDAEALYPVLGEEDLLRLEPDVVLLIEPDAGGAAKRDDQNDPRGAEPPDLGLPGVMDARTAVIDDPAALLPSTTMGRIAAALARRLHPEKAELLRRVARLFDIEK